MQAMTSRPHIGSLTHFDELQPFGDLLAEGQNLLIEGLWDAPQALLLSWARLLLEGRDLLVLTSGVSENRIYDDLLYFLDGGGDLLEFPAWEVIPNEKTRASPDIIGERYRLLGQLIDRPQEGRGKIILTPLQALLQRLPPLGKMRGATWSIRPGDRLEHEELWQLLEELGYQRRPMVSDKGEYALRGDLIDLFPMAAPEPFRIEFFDDEVEGIRAFDPLSQRTTHPAKEVLLTPSRELSLAEGKERGPTLLELLRPNPLVILDDLAALEDRFVLLKEIPSALDPSLSTFSAFQELIGSYQKIYFSKEPIETLGKVSFSAAEKSKKGVALSFPLFDHQWEAFRWQPPFFKLEEGLLREEGEESVYPALSRLHDEGMVLHFIVENEQEKGSLMAGAKKAGFLPLPDQFLERGYLSSGFILPAAQLALIPYPALSHRYKVRRQQMRAPQHAGLAVYHALHPGDLVVHFHQGIGRYLGLEKRPNHEGIPTEYLVIEYAEQGKLYVPITASYLVSRYIGSTEEVPALHVIGGSKWKRQRLSTERAIEEYAQDLLHLQAKRELAEGHPFPADGEELQRFAETFPYQETEDQKKAIGEVFQDMRAPRSMDRLVCGDVGYGKTEVAIRAAAKAILDGKKQVAFLAPTTVLALQHYENCRERMAEFGIRIGLLSRLTSTKERRLLLDQLARGEVDLLIGTHRILNPDVRFHSLGLVVIDEEQRFGVRIKEKLRALRAGVDSLALSATPIPRTLYLSLMGARDLSVINTPPLDRLPIETVIAEKEDELIRQALLRELARDGQAYYIHNRVESIYQVASHLQKLLPRARVAVGHGQMKADELDGVFHAFKQGEIEILVATTIIENGVDIPNANTIIIERADRYGLADLYQMRGRVGRWCHRAYAYLLTPLNRALPDAAQQRLSALLEIGNAGAGMRVAMRDLEIRGAGNILGTEQSGQVAAVGFELYRRLLERAVRKLKGEIPQRVTEVKLDFPIDARIPEEYIPDQSVRMEIYQRFGELLLDEEVDALFEELKDRFGSPPEPVIWLYSLMRIRVFAATRGITSLRWHKGALIIESPKAKGLGQERRAVLLPQAKNPSEFETVVQRAIRSKG